MKILDLEQKTFCSNMNTTNIDMHEIHHKQHTQYIQANSMKTWTKPFTPTIKSNLKFKPTSTKTNSN